MSRNSSHHRGSGIGSSSSRASAPVSEWLVDHVDPRPGQTILELAAGPGETGFLAAERVGADGRLISTDLSAGMIDAARRGAEARGLGNVELRVMDAQQIDLPDGSVDGVISRFGVMLMPEPAAAMRGAEACSSRRRSARVRGLGSARGQSLADRPGRRRSADRARAARRPVRSGWAVLPRGTGRQPGVAATARDSRRCRSRDSRRNEVRRRRPLLERAEQCVGPVGGPDRIVAGGRGRCHRDRAGAGGGAVPLEGRLESPVDGGRGHAR